MKALIYGAGRMGKAAGWDLKRNGIDVDFADANPGHHLWVKDISDQELVDLVANYDVVLGCADYSVNERLTNICIDAKTHFCDLGGNNDVVNRQLALNDKAKEAGIIIIPDCGLAPGMAGLLAACGIEYFGGTADSVKIRVGGLPETPIPPLNYMITWSVRGLINEYLEPCEILRDGEVVFVDALTGVEKFNVNNDPGMYEAFYTSGGLSTLGRSFKDKVKNMDYKTIRYNGHCSAFSAMKAIGLFKDEVTIKNTTYKPRKMLEDLILEHVPNSGYDKVYVRVEVSSGLRKLRYDIADFFNKETGHSAMARTTAYSIATIAYLLCNGDIYNHVGHGGVLPGEIVVPLGKYIAGLKLRGISIMISEYHNEECLYCNIG